MAYILVVEDELLINQLITDGLTSAGHSCVSAFDGVQALDFLRERKFDLIILDVMLPKLSGFEVIKHVSGTPVIFVTAKNRLDDRLCGLDLGAEDYITKPFEMPELLARVRVVLRRASRNERFFVDDLTIDFDAKKVYKAGKEIKLTAKEFGILDMFITNKNCVLTREQILDIVWSYHFDGETLHIIDVYIQQLRKKLGLKDRIKAVYGVGYRFEI
ncbi:MAG: response regulator transcription factor [Clostridia bacterium]|nr:response regulator transcription factor [Clostridia bacterium]MBQ3154782.1 response regulator transcription factor [Clostridia bacterium]